MDAHDVVRAKRFELVDDDDNVRALLSVNPDTNHASLIMVGEGNKPLLSIGFAPRANTPHIFLSRGANEQGSVTIALTEKTNAPAIHLDAENGGNITLGVLDSGEAVLELANSDGNEYQVTPPR